MSTPPVDKQALLELVDHDTDFLETLIETFLEDCSAYIDDLRAAVDDDDAQGVAQAAHELKGAVANLKAEAAHEAAHRVETIGRSGTLDEAPAALERLEAEIDCLVAVLREMGEEG